MWKQAHDGKALAMPACTSQSVRSPSNSRMHTGGTAPSGTSRIRRYSSISFSAVNAEGCPIAWCRIGGFVSFNMFLEQDSRLTVDGSPIPRCSNSIETAAWSQRAFDEALFGLETSTRFSRCAYAAAGGPNQVVSASASPSWVRSPTQATYPSGRINTAVGAVTAPSTGSSHVPTYLASIN